MTCSRSSATWACLTTTWAAIPWAASSCCARPWRSPGPRGRGGQGLDALDTESNRTDGHRRMLAAVADGATFPAGSPEEAVADWIRESGVDTRAVGLVLGTFVAIPADALRSVFAPRWSSSGRVTAAAGRPARSLPRSLTAGLFACPATMPPPSVTPSSQRRFSSFSGNQTAPARRASASACKAAATGSNRGSPCVSISALVAAPVSSSAAISQAASRWGSR
jgi:hypothetical protein